MNRPTTNGHWFGVHRKWKAEGERKELYTRDDVKERHDDTTKEKDTQDTTTVDMAKAKHKHQLVTAMLSKDQDTHQSKERQKGKGPSTWQGDKGKGKGACYRCGQMGQRIAVYECTT